MQIFNFPTKNTQTILALGAESAGNFSVHIPAPLSKGGAGGGLGGRIYFSENFGDLLEEKNWLTFQKAVLDFLKKNKVNCKTREGALGYKIKPQIIITDLHPSMKTTLWGKKISKKFKAQFIQVQHHHAHIFSQIKPLPLSKGEAGRGFKNTSRTIDCEPRNIFGTRPVLAKQFYGVAIDGTGYGTDEKIWGGECFAISNSKLQNKEIQIERIGHLENQILLGGELAIKEPARMLISILNKVFSSSPSGGGCPVIRTGEGANKNLIYPFIKKYYSKNEFELLYNQLEQNFNCIETSSAGRILDAVSLLLGFCPNKRNYKHAAIDLLEKNSARPYTNLKPKIIQISTTNYELQTTALFEYLIKNLHKDKKRLAATAQLYLAQGLHEIIQKHTNHPLSCTQGRAGEGLILSGGLSENRIIKNYFISQGIFENKKPYVPKGDAGLSFGQIIYLLWKK